MHLCCWVLPQARYNEVCNEGANFWWPCHQYNDGRLSSRGQKYAAIPPASSEEEGWCGDEESDDKEDDWLSLLAGSSGSYETGIIEEGSGDVGRCWAPVAQRGEHELALKGEHN